MNIDELIDYYESGCDSPCSFRKHGCPCTDTADALRKLQAEVDEAWGIIHRKSEEIERLRDSERDELWKRLYQASQQMPLGDFEEDLIILCREAAEALWKLQVENERLQRALEDYDE